MRAAGASGESESDMASVESGTPSKGQFHRRNSVRTINPGSASHRPRPGWRRGSSEPEHC